MARRKGKHPADVYAEQQIARAVHFVVYRVRGRDANERENHDTLQQARDAAAGDVRAIIYAVTPDGAAHHVPAAYIDPKQPALTAA